MRIERFYLYPDRTDVTLTTYLQEDSPEITRGFSRPAVIICPGGAYLMLSDREAEPIAMQFAAMGYHSFILHYSVLNRNKSKGFPADLSELPAGSEEILFPAQIQELGMAMMLIHEHAEQWRIDPLQIGIAGFSAGGHVCAAYSTFWHTSLVAGTLGAAAEQLRPAFCILGYPFIDFCYNAGLDLDPYSRMAYERMDECVFGTIHPTEEQRRNASPNYHVTEMNPPTFLWNCSTDPSVLPQHILRMATALAEKKVPFELHSFDGGPHGMALATAATSVDRTQMGDAAAKWIDLLQTWLRKYVHFPHLEESEA